MKYHAINGQKTAALCGRRINNISGFYFPVDEFQGHYYTDGACRTCNKSLKKVQYKENRGNYGTANT